MTEAEEQARRVTEALLTRPALAAAVYKNLREIVFVGPWFEMEEAGIFIRETQMGSSQKILALVRMKELTPPSVSFDERWVAEVFDPRGTASKRSEFGSRKEAMDEADSYLEGMGVVFLEESP